MYNLHYTNLFIAVELESWMYESTFFFNLENRLTHLSVYLRCTCVCVFFFFANFLLLFLKAAFNPPPRKRHAELVTSSHLLLNRAGTFRICRMSTETHSACTRESARYN